MTCFGSYQKLNRHVLAHLHSRATNTYFENCFFFEVFRRMRDCTKLDDRLLYVLC